MSYKRILVPVDGSDTSNKALMAAAKLAQEAGGRVRVMLAIDEFELFSIIEHTGELMKTAREQGQDILDDALALVESEGVAGDTHLMEARGQRLGDVVAQEAAAWQADLVAVGTHGRRGLGRMLLGSGAESVIRLATVPVLVIRGDEGQGS